MARIPLGPFESATVQAPVQRSRVSNPGTLPIADAAQRLGQTGMNIAGGMLRDAEQDRQRQKAEDEALARAKAANALLDDEVQVKATTEALQQRVQTGELDWRKAREEAEKAFSQLKVAPVEGLAPDDAERMQGGIKRNRMAGDLAVKTIADGARRSEFRGQFDAALDSLGKLANAPGADITKINAQAEAFSGLAREAGVEPAKIQAQIQGFKDRNWTNQATQRSIGARDNLAGLNQLEHDLTAEDGFYADKLDTDKRNAILSQVTVAKGRIEAKTQHDADKREAAAGRAIAAYQTQASTGVPPPVDTLTKWSDQVKGTSYEDEFRDMLKGEAEVQAILNKPPAEQQAYLQSVRARQQTAGATVAQQGNLKRLETAVETNLKQLRDSPLVFYANRTGRTVAPLSMEALASGDVSALQGQISERMTTLATVHKQFGPEAGNAPLLPQEAAALSAALAKAPPASAVQLYGTLSRAIGDPAAYRAAMQQIAPDSPVRALAGMVYAQQRSTTLQSGGIFSGAVKASAGDIAQTMLAGEELLNRSKTDKGADGKGGAFPMPAPGEFGDALADAVGEVFAGRPGAYETATQAVRAYYAGSAAKAGDVTGELDNSRLREAVRAVLGEPVDINGNGDVLPPWGMDEDTFEDKLDVVWAQAEKLLPAGVSTDFGDYGLRQLGDGVYYVVGTGGEFLPGKDGRPVRLQVTP